MSKRLTKDQYLWRQAFAASARGTCDRFRGGCVIAREGVCIATGYNGSAPGEAHCEEAGHELVTSTVLLADSEPCSSSVTHCVRTIHAEMNAIINCAIIGVSAVDCDWYITGVPCQPCAMAMARLKPHELFVCIDGGTVEDDREKLTQWWARRATCITVYSLETLTKLGVTL